MTKKALASFMSESAFDSQTAMTMLGAEFEFEWYEPSVPAGGKVYLKVTSPPNKYTLVNFREIRFDQTKGMYRQYRTFSGGTVSRTITPVKMRGDSNVASEATIQVVTGPTVNEANAFSAIPLWGAEGVGNRPQGGGLSQQGSFRVIPPGTVTLLEFENNSTNAAAWYAYFKQFEVKASTMLQLAEL